MKKTWLSLGLIGVAVTPLMSVVACGKSSVQNNDKVLVNQIKNYFRDVTLSAPQKLNAVSTPTPLTQAIFNGWGQAKNTQGTKVEWPTSTILQGAQITYTLTALADTIGAQATATLTITKGQESATQSLHFVRVPSPQNVVKNVQTELEAISVFTSKAVVTIGTPLPFNKIVLDNLVANSTGRMDGAYPTSADMQQVDLTYEVPNIAQGSKGDLIVTITSKQTPTVSARALLKIQVAHNLPEVDVDYTVAQFNKAQLSITDAQPFATINGGTPFNKSSLTKLKGTLHNGDKYAVSFPAGIDLTYSAIGLSIGQAGYLNVSIDQTGTPAQIVQIPISTIDPQKNVDDTLVLFVNANLSVKTNQAVAADSDTFNLQILKALGGTISGTYPTNPLPQGVGLSYQVNAISKGSSGTMEVTIYAAGAASQTFDITIEVS